MSNGGVASLAIITALLTAVGTVFVIEKTGVFEPPVAMSTVPDLRGMDEQSATGSLQSVGLVLLRGGSLPTTEAKPGTIVRQSIAPGTKIGNGETVLVTFAGEVPRVPTVTGLTLDEARHAIERAGYDAVVGDPAYDDSVPEGKVLSQTPVADQELAEGKSVIIKLSKGAGKVELPNLRGQAASQASEQLKQLGLVAKIRWVQWPETSSNVVLKQLPAEGEMVARDSEVELTVNR